MNQVRLNAAQAASPACEHTDQATTVSYAERVCPECVAMGDRWVHLRICMICGHVGCCDSSKNKHARAHFEKTRHPIIKEHPARRRLGLVLPGRWLPGIAELRRRGTVVCHRTLR